MKEELENFISKVWTTLNRQYSLHIIHGPLSLFIPASINNKMLSKSLSNTRNPQGFLNKADLLLKFVREQVQGFSCNESQISLAQVHNASRLFRLCVHSRYLLCLLIFSRWKFINRKLSLPPIPVADVSIYLWSAFTTISGQFLRAFAPRLDDVLSLRIILIFQVISVKVCSIAGILFSGSKNRKDFAFQGKMGSCFCILQAWLCPRDIKLCAHPACAQRDIIIWRSITVLPLNLCTS